MDSNELNERIAAICDDDMHYAAFGGKAIPYIGWFWREVNFDHSSCLFGVIPDDEVLGDKPLVGFMENNKWGYGYIHCDGEDWVEIKQLLEAAVTDTCRETLQAVNDKIQSLLPERKSEEAK